MHFCAFDLVGNHESTPLVEDFHRLRKYRKEALQSLREPEGRFNAVAQTVQFDGTRADIPKLADILGGDI